MVTAVSTRELKDVLLDPGLSSTKQSYFTIASPDSEENLTVLSTGKIGNEFNKTLGFINRYPGALIYRCLYGQGVIVVQKNDLGGNAKEVRVVGLRPGVEVEVPSGYAHTIINTGRTFLAVVDNLPKDKKYTDWDTIKQRRGLSYYVIDKKGDIGFEKNPNYEFHPQITN